MYDRARPSITDLNLSLMVMTGYCGAYTVRGQEELNQLNSYDQIHYYKPKTTKEARRTCYLPPPHAARAQKLPITNWQPPSCTSIVPVQFIQTCLGDGHLPQGHTNSKTAMHVLRYLLSSPQEGIFIEKKDHENPEVIIQGEKCQPSKKRQSCFVE